MRNGKRLRAWVWSVAACLAVVLPALAADLGTEIAQLTTAVSERIDATPDAKEAKKLGKALKRLDGVVVAELDEKDLAKIVAAVAASKTGDEAVLAEAADVLDCIRASAVTERAAVQAFLGQLDDRFARKLERKIGGGDKVLDKGFRLVEGNPKKAAKLFAAAVKRYVKARAFAEKALERQRGGGNLGNKVQMAATIRGEGFSRTFREFASAFGFGNQLTVQGCDFAGPDDVCRTVLAFTIQYDGVEGRQTGPVPPTVVNYSESSDFGDGSGPGVQDVTWSGGPLSVEILESSGGRIKGRFSGQARAESLQQPDIVTIEGTFVVKRPTSEGF